MMVTISLTDSTESDWPFWSFHSKVCACETQQKQAVTKKSNPVAIDFMIRPVRNNSIGQGQETSLPAGRIGTQTKSKSNPCKIPRKNTATPRINTYWMIGDHPLVENSMKR
jgi:hypothetical protein